MLLIFALVFQIGPVFRYFSINPDTIKPSVIFIQSAVEKDTTSWFFTNFGGTFDLKSGFSAEISVFFKHGNDSTYPTYNWHGIGSMDYKKALLSYTGKDLSASIGLDAPKLSQGYFTSLFFNGLEPEFPRIKFRYLHKGFEFGYLTGQMKESRSNEFWRNPETKYFSFHSIGYTYHNLEAKFSEAVLFRSYNDNTVDWYLLMPLAIWYPRQANYHGTDLNILWLFSLKWKFKEGKILYGDFMIDDAPYKREADENPRVGGLLGLMWKSPEWTRIFEGSFVTRYTYSYYPERLYLSWFYNGFPLGTLTGTDFVKFSTFLMHRVGIYFYGEILMQGEGVAGEPFNLGHLSRKVLLSGKVHTQLRIYGGFSRSLNGTHINLILGFIHQNEFSPSGGILITRKWSF